MSDHGISLGACTNRTLLSFIKLIPSNIPIQHLQALSKEGFWYSGESEDGVLYISMTVIDKIW
jgi:hypothetical protein